MDEPRAGDGGALTLGTLLDAERELSERVTHARDEGRRIVEEAIVAAAELEGGDATELDAAVHALEAEQRDAAERAVSDLLAAAQGDAARFDAVSATLVAALAEEVLLDFLGVVALGAEASPP
jgi:vacuolar-type H+-ATPase subunit H